MQWRGQTYITVSIILLFTDFLPILRDRASYVNLKPIYTNCPTTHLHLLHYYGVTRFYKDSINHGVNTAFVFHTKKNYCSGLLHRRSRELGCFQILGTKIQIIHRITTGNSPLTFDPNDEHWC
jgi:hypothetical protein